MRSVFALLVLLLHANSVIAHPGHGSGDGSSVSHYATSPVHFWPYVGAAIVLTLAVWAQRRISAARRAKRSKALSSHDA